MTDKTHQLIGLTAATGLFFITYPSQPVTLGIASAIIVGSFIGSIFPDIDQPTNGIWRAIPLGGVAAKIAHGTLAGHRNLSHSFLGLILFWLLAGWASHHIPGHFIHPHFFYLSCLVGFVGHLLADTITVRGIPFFWPFGSDMGFPPRPLEGIRIVTGHWFENIIIFPATAITLAIIIATHYRRF